MEDEGGLPVGVVAGEEVAVCDGAAEHRFVSLPERPITVLFDCGRAIARHGTGDVPSKDFGQHTPEPIMGKESEQKPGTYLNFSSRSRYFGD